MKILTAAKVAVAATMTAALVACGAGSQTASRDAATAECGFEPPANPVDVNVLAYNSSAIDPYTNAMVKSCSKDKVTVRHDPIDFAGQVQRTQATLGGQTGTYDLIETYGFILPGLAEQKQVVPLNDLFDKYSSQYRLDQISPDLKKRMSYNGQLLAVPMQAQAFTMVYRKDIFDELGLQVPTTFPEMAETAKKIKDAGKGDYPLALPLLSSGDLATAYVAALGSLGKQYVDPATKRPNFDTPESKKAIEAIKSLLPYMDPEVLTFDQPRVQQQLFNGNAAMAIMFSGRMVDLVDPKQSDNAANFAFAPPPSVEPGGKLYSQVSIDGWSIPHNTDKSHDLLFHLIGASVSEEASKASIPAAYPARQGLATAQNMPWATAIEASISGAPEPQLVPWAADMSNETINVLAQTVSGQKSVDDGAADMQRIGEQVMTKY